MKVQNFPKFEGLAVKTLRAIDDCLEKDQGSRYRTELAEAEIGANAKKESPPYLHRLGPSSITVAPQCDRRLFLKARNVSRSQFKARTIRIFQRGNREEPNVYALLRQGGIAVINKEEAYSMNNLFYAHVDGLVSLVPDCNLKETGVLEIKTMNDTNFQSIERSGLQKAEPGYFIQVQAYLLLSKLPWALFICVNKDRDDLYAEIVKPSEITRGEIKTSVKKAFVKQAPERIKPAITQWPCSVCFENKVCFGKELPNINCRTCVNFSWMKGGYCNFYKKVLDKFDQYKACQFHIYKPDLLQASITSVEYNKKEKFYASISFKFDDCFRKFKGYTIQWVNKYQTRRVKRDE